MRHGIKQYTTPKATCKRQKNPTKWDYTLAVIPARGHGVLTLNHDLKYDQRSILSPYYSKLQRKSLSKFIAVSIKDDKWIMKYIK